MAAYAFAFFATGYIAFIVAPGIVPTAHFCDVPAMIFFTLFFRHKKPLWLGLGLVVSARGPLLASQFGTMLTVAVAFTLSFYVCENYEGKRRYLRLVAIIAYVTATLSLPRLLAQNTSHSFFTYYLMGYFSFQPYSIVPIATIVYLVASYAFLLSMKNERFYLKYVYCLVFSYNQAMLVYYYWSGLLNHLPMALPLIGVQISDGSYVG